MKLVQSSIKVKVIYSKKSTLCTIKLERHLLRLKYGKQKVQKHPTIYVFRDILTAGKCSRQG